VTRLVDKSTRNRFPLFDDIRRELGRVAAADVPDRVDRLGRDEQDVTGLKRRQRLRPGTLRSCRRRSVRLSPGACCTVLLMFSP
jgi:hypothetical protein